MAEKMTRRTFMKSAAAAAAAISLSGMLAGCGSSGPSQNEVRVGAFIVAVYDVKGNVGGTVLGSGSNGSITATVKLTYSSSGKGSVEYPYGGMFTAKVKENQLKTLKPTSGKLQASNAFGPYKKENVTQLELQFDNNESSGAFLDGAPVELTIQEWKIGS
jgi:hypothetical protein